MARADHSCFQVEGIGEHFKEEKDANEDKPENLCIVITMERITAMTQHTVSTRIAAADEEIRSYLQDLANVPVLSPDAEREAIQQIASAPQSAEAMAARNRLIEAHLYMVVYVAKRYQQFGPEFADLIGEGNLALTLAAHQFDPQHGQCFRSFAYRQVHRALLQMVEAHLHERDLVETDTEQFHSLNVCATFPDSMLNIIGNLSTMQEQVSVGQLPGSA